MLKPLLTLIAAVALVTFAETDSKAATEQSPAPAVQSSASSAPSRADGPQPEVTITGDLAEYASKISAFVNQLTNFNLDDPTRGLARWQEPACPLVTGLPRGQGEYILGRISEIAHAVGAPLGAEKCRPNLFIIVSTHPEADLRDLEKRHRSQVFGEAPPALVEDFIATSRPVRTWYDTVERTPEGLPLMNMSFPGISQNTRNGKNEIIPVRPSLPDDFNTQPWSQASHLVLNVVWAIKQDFVVVDPKLFKGVSLGQLADYVAMSGLAQIKLDTRLGDDPTILTLFDKNPQAASAGLTAWDQAFLMSIYASEQKSVLQRSQIAQDMVRETAH